jgi:hypothetical protein
MATLGPLKPSIYILGIIFFIGIILSGMALVAEFQRSDSTFMADQQTAAFNSTFNQYNSLTSSVSSLQSSASSSGNNWGVFGVLNSLIGSAWNALVLLWTSLGFMSTVFGGLALFGVPVWVGALFGLVVVVIIAFAIFSSIFRQEI